MAKCNYCGKELSENTLLKDGKNAFCNDHCRHKFETNGNKPKDGASSIKSEKRSTKSKKATTLIGVITAAIVAAVVGQLTNGFMQKDFAELKEFKSPDSSFTIMLPKGVKEGKQTVSTDIGTINFISYNVKAKHQEFTVAFSDYPDSYISTTDPQMLLDGSRDGAIGNIQGKLLKESFIHMNRHPGRELQIESPQKLILKSRIYLVGNRLYQIMAVSKPDHASDKEIEEVFNSFMINGI
jgi:hypothetical protein